MNAQGLLFIALVTGIHLFKGSTASLEFFHNVTYEEIEYLNATCIEADNCTEVRDNDNLDFYNCNCDEFCTQYDTCCVDSQYRDKVSKVRKPYSCVKIYGTKQSVFMIDICGPSWNGDNSTEAFCRGSAEELDDLFLAVPVTNHKSGITYRNYYCAVCNNEKFKELTFWHLSLESMAEDIMDSPLPDLHYIPSAKEWIIGDEIYDIREDKVKPVAVIPGEIKDKVHDCVPDIISDCAENWTDASVKEKCVAYMAVVRLPGKKMFTLQNYRNPHCAICNYKSFERKVCPTRYQPLQSLIPSNTFFVRLFSLYDKENKCDEDKVYDTIAKKCRKVYKG